MKSRNLKTQINPPSRKRNISLSLLQFSFYYWSYCVFPFSICLLFYFCDKSAFISGQIGLHCYQYCFSIFSLTSLRAVTRCEVTFTFGLKKIRFAITAQFQVHPLLQSTWRGDHGSGLGAAWRVVCESGLGSLQGQGDGSGFPCCTWRIYKWGYFSLGTGHSLA